MNNEEKQFFRPGDIVTLKQEISNKPKMIVVRKEMNYLPDNLASSQLRGIRCRWFSEGGILQEATWNTKDLIKL